MNRTKHRFSRPEIKLLFISVAAIAVLGGVAWWRASINAMPQVTIPPYPKAPVPNGYDVYLKAAKAIVLPNPHVDSVQDPDPPKEAKARAQKYSLARKEAWLKQNAAGFALFRKAQNLPCLTPPMRRLGEFPNFGPIRELARTKLVEVHTYEMRGDWGAAMQCRLDILKMGATIGQDGPMTPNITAHAIQSIARTKIKQNIEKLSAPEARAAIKRLEFIYARRVQYADVLREGLRCDQSQLLEDMSQPHWRDIGRLCNRPSWQDRAKAYFTSKTTVMNNVTSFYDVLIANANLPYNARKQPLPVVSDPLSYYFTRNLDSRWPFVRTDAANAMLLVALALHAYKIEHEAYPTTLQELVPGYLKQIPADPAGSGEAMRYRRTATAYKLWSIGIDGVDDGGKPMDSKNELVQSMDQRTGLPIMTWQGKDDYVWGKNR